MKSSLYAVALAAAFALSPILAQTPAPPPIEAFATLPTISDPALSPDGKFLALIQVYQGRPVATIRQLDALTATPVVIPFDDGFIVHVRWANNHRLLITINMNARVHGEHVKPWFRTIAIDPDGKNPVVLFKNQDAARDINYSASSVADLAIDDPDHIYMPLWTLVGSIFDYTARSSIYQVDVNTGFAAPVVRGNARSGHWIMDGTGRVAARVERTNNPLTDHIQVHTPDDDWKEIAATDATGGNGIGVFGLSMDGKSLVISAIQEGSGIGGLALMSLADGKITGLYSHPLYDLSDVIDDPWSGRVVGATVTAHVSEDFYFDPKLQEVQNHLKATFSGMSAHAMSWDRERNRFIVSVDGPMSPPAFYLYTVSTNQILRIGRNYAQLQIGNFGETRVYDYKARDGLEIPAYLTLPPGKTAKKSLPVVIMPHGGPMARDDMSFNWDTQFLANRGYAVLQPNFRGSSGYGTKFMESGYGQWGLKMQDDVTDGVKKLIADGIADPKRICIVGGSYGGYAALAGAALTPDLYACAAAWAPVTGLRDFLATRSQDYGSDSAMISSWERFIGDRWSDSGKLDAASPVENADKIKIPVLLMHGEADATVRIDQSERMDRELRHAGKRVTFVKIPLETHYMQTQDTRVRWLTELEKFLKENIGN